MHYTYCVITNPGHIDEGPWGDITHDGKTYVLGGACDDLVIPMPTDKGTVLMDMMLANQVNEMGLSSMSKIEGLLHVKRNVFTKGEIVILNDYGREVCGQGRKPSKWFIEYEELDNIDDAIARAVEVTKEDYA